MKRKGYLFDKIVSLDNLYLASKKAQRGKSKYPEIIKWNENLEENIQRLYQELKSKTYIVSEYSTFTIYENKLRIISKLPFKDRIVHHATLIHLESIFIKCFISQSYSCLPKRGIHKCLRDLRKALKCKDIYCLKIDIKKFYPSVSNIILKDLLRKKFKDENLLWLLDNIIDSIKGLPLGSYTSQYLANFYLNSFDHWIKEVKKIKFYFKYLDDIVILGNSKEELHTLRREIQDYLKDNLELELSNFQVFKIDLRGIDFVGYRIYSTHTLLRKGIKNRFIKMLKYNKNDKSIASYYGWLCHCHSKNLQKKYLPNGINKNR